MHSRMYDKIKKWFALGVWSAAMVHDAVPRMITAEEYTEITGLPYEP